MAGSSRSSDSRRYYDPATGQFTQEVPLGLAGGTNAYGFAGGDPVNEVDPFGTDCPPGKVVLVCVLIQVFSKFGVPVAPFVHKEPIVVRNPSAPTLPKPLETPELPDWGDIGSESAEAKTRLNPRIGGGGGKGPSEADPSETLREIGSIIAIGLWFTALWYAAIAYSGAA